MKMLYAPTAPALFGVSCWDNLQSIHDWLAKMSTRIGKRLTNGTHNASLNATVFLFVPTCLLDCDKQQISCWHPWKLFKGGHVQHDQHSFQLQTRKLLWPSQNVPCFVNLLSKGFCVNTIYMSSTHNMCDFKHAIQKCTVFCWWWRRYVNQTRHGTEGPSDKQNTRSYFEIVVMNIEEQMRFWQQWQALNLQNEPAIHHQIDIYLSEGMQHASNRRFGRQKVGT